MDREEIKSELQSKKWFTGSSDEIQNEILELPDDFDGFLHDLITRPDEFEGLDVLRISKLARGNFIITPVFEVRSHLTNQIFTYEYASFKYGKHSGFRGIILLELEGKIEFFLIKWTRKFSVGSWVYDTLGDFIQFKDGKLVNFPKKVENEIKEELGLQQLNIKRFIDLGSINTDVTLSNRQVSLFAAIVDANESEKLREIKDKTFETKKISFGVKVIPLSMLSEYVAKVDDSYFLACISRLASMNIVRFS